MTTDVQSGIVERRRAALAVYLKVDPSLVKVQTAHLFSIVAEGPPRLFSVYEADTGDGLHLENWASLTHNGVTFFIL